MFLGKHFHEMMVTGRNLLLRTSARIYEQCGGFRTHMHLNASQGLMVSHRPSPFIVHGTKKRIMHCSEIFRRKHRCFCAQSASPQRNQATDASIQESPGSEELPLNANCVACVATEVEVANCWSCGAKRKSAHDLFCRSCGSIQPPVKSSFFDLLGVNPPDFEIDVKKVEARYKNLMRMLHPDKYMQQCARQRDFSSVSFRSHLKALWDN